MPHLPTAIRRLTCSRAGALPRYASAAILAILALCALSVGPALANGGASFPANQPFSSYWFPNDLLTWSAATDPDAPYNTSGVPLADRFSDPATQANSHAREGEARVASLAIMYPTTSNNPSQGSDAFRVNAFHSWEYVDILVTWGGSAGEGLILSPSADVIDAAHRNGVPVLGTIFFPPNVFGGQIQWVRDLVQKTGAVYPVADKLIDVANAYGFDGWFINQETSGGDSLLALEIQSFMKYIQANKPSGMHIMWYDSMVRTGAIAWQNALNNQNKMFFEDDAIVPFERVSDEMFLNFLWANTGKLQNSRSKAQMLARDPYDVFAGIDVQANGYNTSADWDTLFTEGQSHTVSLGFYGAEWPYASTSIDSIYYQRESRFWVGANRNPSNTTTASAWKGIAHYVPERSTINDVPFVTSFNTGHGAFFAVNGAVLKTGDWNNRGVQDVLPTWRWIATSSGTPLYPAFDWSDAYYGGSCLKVSGALDASNGTLLKLFKTNVAVTSDLDLSVAYKRGVANVPSRMSVGLAFADNPTAVVLLPVDSTSSAGWNTQTLALGAHAGRTLIALSLDFASSVSEPAYAMKIGQLALVEGAVDIPAPAASAFVEDAVMSDSRTASLRLRWTHSPDPVHAYNVYRVNPDDTRTYLGGTANNAYFVYEMKRVGAESTTTIEVVAVGDEFGHATPATTSFFWGAGPPNDAPIANANGGYCALAGTLLKFESDGTRDPDGTITSYAWDFGDAATSTDAEPIHVYAAPGNYAVTLTVTDDFGAVRSDTTIAAITSTPIDATPSAAWYALDDGAGAAAADSSGNGNNGVVVNALWAAGIQGGALNFDGSGDYVRVANYPKPASTMSVTAWVNADSRPGWASIAKNWAGDTGAFHFGLHSGDGDLEVQVAESDGGVVSLRECLPIPLGEWHHVAVIADGAEVRLYRNANLIARTPYDGTLKVTRPALGIGVKLNNAGTGPDASSPGYWDGLIDDVRIYDRAICHNELATLHGLGVLTGVGTGDGDVDNDDGIDAGTSSASFALEQNEPNPFRPPTHIRFRLPAPARVTLSVYDVSGRRVADLLKGQLASGEHFAAWDGRGADGRAAPAGVYVYRLSAGAATAVRKMHLLR
ncbi:MAG: endo-beta-N-acetylglucosaminidase [bacterium]